MKIIILDTLWHIYFVPFYSDMLYDARNDRHTLGMTDGDLYCIFISDGIDGEKLKEVLQHELSHAYAIVVGDTFDLREDEHMAQFNGEFADDISDTAREIIERIGK